MDNEVKIEIENKAGESKTITIPNNIGLNLMEVLKASEFDIEATCGGMALCATCHVRIMEGLNSDTILKEEEINMLDTLPKIYPESRLSCQIPISIIKQKIKVKLL